MDLDNLLACPACGADALERKPQSLVCGACERSFELDSGIPDLIVGDRFEDNSDCCVWENEECTGKHLADNYLLKLLAELFPGRAPASLRVLSIGCGVGADVEVLNSHGYEAYGVDAGGRPALWARRSNPERFFLANARRLPFKDTRFDFVFLCCVIPHIGMQGDTFHTKSSFREERQEAWDEALRVLAPGGHIMLSGPNRRCPLDLFHRPHHWVHLPRLHGPRDPFLLGVSDYREQLEQRGGCKDFRVLPIGNYWGFFISSRYALGRLLQIPMRALFALMTWDVTRLLRSSALNPWLIVCARK